MKKLLLLILFCLFTTNCFAADISKVSRKEVYKTTLGTENDEVVIGDEKSVDFKPQITFTKWNKENSLTIKVPDGLIASSTPTLSAGKVEIKDSKTGFYFNPDPDNPDNFKFGLILYEKPTTNTWTFAIEGNFGLRQIKRPPLIKDNGNGTKTFDSSGGIGEHENSQQFYRQDIVQITNPYTGLLVDVVQSRHFLTFLRPKFIDAKGNWVLADLEIKGEDYIVTVDREWLEKAVYPIKANDTVIYQEGTLSTCDDNELQQGAVTTNHGSSVAFDISTYDTTDKRNACVKWDLSGIPVGATITAVTISFKTSYAGQPNVLVRCHRLLRNWVEAESTWNIYSTGNNWGTAGGSNDTDRSLTESANHTVGTTTETWETWGSTAQLVTDVQNFLNGVWSNYGWIFIEDYVVFTYCGFHSSEYATIADRPYITITYTPSGATGSLLNNCVINNAGIY